MSEIKIQANSSGGGVYTLQSGAGSTDRTITLPDKAGEVAVGAGTIVQVVQATTNTEVAVSSSTYTDTGVTASITPTSSSNKVLVIINQQFQVHRTSAGQGMGFKILRDSTEIYVPPDNSTGPFLSYVNATEHLGVITLNYLDSPSTTSSTTYKAQGRPYLTSSSGVVRYQTTTNGVTAGTSLITLMEVVA
mgnify:CR=1 FL=1|tara:strand:- start:278 stop:850 length:573 start_codon:yes stop_codon:yes gene_type:complete